MSQVNGKVLKHNEQTRAMHWVHLIAFILLGLTGIGFYFQIDFINNLFGGGANASAVHRWTGVIFALGPTLYILLNFERFSRFVDTITSISKNDMKWMSTMGGYIPFLKGDVPPQDKYNAGQKMLGLLIILGCLIIIITGFPMWVWADNMAPAFISLCWNVHFWTAMVMILLVAGHFFLAAIHPTSRVEFGAMMLDGHIDADVTAHHNGTWFKTLKEIEE